MSLLFTHAFLITPLETIEDGAILISNEGFILNSGRSAFSPSADRQIDLQGSILAPAYVDIHVHGGNGISFGSSDNPSDELDAYRRWVVGTGVGGFLPSLAAPDPAALFHLVSSYAQALEEANREASPIGALPLGLHLEGPYLNREKKGAFNPAWLRMPSLGEIDALVEAGKGWIKQVTLAPELPGAREVAHHLRAVGVTPSLGHTSADYEVASLALQGDFRHITHTFNAQSGFHHRQPGVFGAILTSDDVTAEVIGDGVHAHPGAIKVLLRCLGTDRVVLITDAMSAAGLADGEYSLVGNPVFVKDGQAHLADGTIAGSTATLDACVRNVYRWAGIPLADALKMASLIPVRAMHLDSTFGSLVEGKIANLVVLDHQGNVEMTVIKGQLFPSPDNHLIT
jgi:N-acetylglucosamine-6-phosphate deacetylase